MKDNNLYFELLKEWCDRLISLQVTEFAHTRLYGGIMCPACARIHGRCGDAIYPMMYLADVTGEEKYLECAKKLFIWTENMVRPDGGYNNDTNSDWRGITVFAMIQMGEALHYHGHLLDEKTHGLWMERFLTAADYLYHNIDAIGGNINYPVTCAHAMAVAAQMTKEGRYKEKARSLAHMALRYVTEDGLLYGEGKNKHEVSMKGCRPVDLGYNVEESLPALLHYAILEQDMEVYEAAVASMKIHLEFMLPDGAWDNSWGTRNNKWSYWGSRTSDGCQSGYGYPGLNIPEFQEAAYRNAKLLKACTHDGLLHGGPMYHTAGEPPCVHHTFCHAKGLAVYLANCGDGKSDGANQSVPLPRERQDGIRSFPSVHVNLLARGPWRATVSDYDVEYSKEGHATGGALTLLWHEAIGPVFTGTMTGYEMVEVNNMQLPPYTRGICLTPRLEYERDGVMYRSINDKSASVECMDDGRQIRVLARGNLTDAGQRGVGSYRMEYRIEGGQFTIEAWTDVPNVRFWIPVVSPAGEEVIRNYGQDDCRMSIVRGAEKGVLTVKADAAIRISKEFPKKKSLGLPREYGRQEPDRIFNPVGGMEAIPCYVELKPQEKVSVTLSMGNI